MKPDESNSGLPVFFRGIVVKGLGRGSKEMGIPTANLDDECVSNLSPALVDGVYAGVAKVVGYDGIFPAACSLGKNVHFNEVKRTAEVHILNTFDPDLFYGHQIYVCFIAWLRGMQSFQTIGLLTSNF
ncbi:Riboflavin kinase [Thelohanellus kitauei]|uniref:riboflavin kinase n=1 Tax=Thelohanellus kitauei TaxID=669202 RepID=A0A0C2MXR9_THEKT|nr:Riboflavin kinase [Thelohanellus kitauei]